MAVTATGESTYNFLVRKLIFASTYINDLNRVELTEMWLQLVRHFNPDCDIVLVDVPADPSFSGLVPSLQHVQNHIVAEGAPLPPLKPGINWISFTDNIGHLSHNNGQDGPSRSFCRGIEIALAGNYDYVAHIEGDVLCRLKFDDAIVKMQRHHIGALSTITTKWNLMEAGVIFMECNYLREIQFLEKYDWRTIAKRERGEWPENKIAETLQGRLLFDLWYGGRDENDAQHGLFDRADIPRLQFLTHARQWYLYHDFMNYHAPSLGWRPLFPDLMYQ